MSLRLKKKTIKFQIIDWYTENLIEEVSDSEENSDD